MSDLTFVPDHADPAIRFESAPVHNMLCSLCMLNQEHLDHISPWVDEMLSQITEQEKQDAEIACHAVGHVRWTQARTLPEFITSLTAVSPERIVEEEFSQRLSKAAHYLPGADLPSIDQIMTDEDVYVELIRRLMQEKDPDYFDEAETREEWARYQSPSDYRDNLVRVLEHFYEKYLKKAWADAERSIGESVTGFRSVSIPAGTLEERLRFVTGRDFIPQMWIETLEEAKSIVYVPSVHIGPYMILFDFDGSTAYLVGRARIPEGATVRSPDLDRSELLVRLDALGDATRMRILELTAELEMLTTQDAIDRLELSQSSASRHLNQLAATGLLKVDGSERTKKYRINPQRLEDVCAGLKQLIAVRVQA